MARIVVVGGGFAGYSALKTLHKRGVTERHEVVLVDPSTHFVYLPSLPYLLTRKKSIDDITASLGDIARRLGATHVRDAVTHVDAESRRLHLESGEALSYDKLIICAGAQPEYYGVPGAETALPAWRLPHYLRIMDRLERGAGRIIVVGGGLTGVEVAGELLERLGPGNVTIIERMDHLLPFLNSRKASEIAWKFLHGKGLEIVLGAGVSSVEDGRGVVLDDGRRLEGDAVIWTVGIRASSISIEPEPQRKGRGWLEVDDYLRVQGVKDIYAAGDASLFSVDGAYACKMAEEALLQGRTAAVNVALEIAGAKPAERHTPLFRTDRSRTLLSIGFNKGIAVWDSIVFSGGLPYTAKMLIESAVMRDVKGRMLGDLLTGMEVAFIKTLNLLTG